MTNSDTQPGTSPAQLPVACSLDGNDRAERMRRWELVGAAGASVARRRGNQLEVRFERAPGVRDELEALAAAERECCGFVTWQVIDDPGTLVLLVTADSSRPDDVMGIATLFGVGVGVGVGDAGHR